MTAINYSKTAEKSYVDDKFFSSDKVLYLNGHAYKVIKVGLQLWMSENLDEEVGLLGNNEWYYDNDESTYGRDGKKYGRLYNWTNLSTNLENKLVDFKASAWHLPTIEEWRTFLIAVGNKDVAGLRLKSSKDWNDENGIDYYSFNALPSGSYDSSFTDVGDKAVFVTSSESDDNYYAVSFNYNNSFEEVLLDKSNGNSVRLVLNLNSDGSLPEDNALVYIDSIMYNDRKISQVQPDGTYKEIIETYNKDEIDEKFENINTFGVTVGNRTYRCEKIGNQLWMAENLDYKFEGCVIGATGTPTTSNAWYYNNDEATYGIDGTRKCGLLYNWYAIKYLEDNKSTLLPNGWRVPTRDDYSTLISESGISRAGHYLKAEDNYLGNWPTNWNGIDEHNIAVLPSGYRNDSGNFTGVSESAYLWTSNEVSADNAYAMMFARLSENLMSASYSKVCGIPVRLVLTLNDDGSIPSGYQVNKALATKEYVDSLVGNVEALLAAL